MAVSRAAAPRVTESRARSDLSAPKPSVDQPPLETSRTPKPWDDPKWDDMVASKLLEILLKMPDDGVRTGSLSEPNEPAPTDGPPPTTPTPSTTTEARAPEPPPAGPADVVPLPRPGEQDEAGQGPPVREPTGAANAAAAAPVPEQNRAAPEPSVVASRDVSPPSPAPVSPPAPAVVPPMVPEPDRPGAVPQPETRAPLPPARPSALEGGITVARAGPLDEETERAARPTVAASKKAAEQTAAAYLKAWSSPNGEALPRLRKLSADRVEYFGRSISRDAWSRIKRTFADKWPVRQYRPRPETMTAECDQNGRCTVRAIVDWTTAHPGRADSASGSSKLELGIDTSGRQMVVYRDSMLVIRSAVRRPPPSQSPRPALRTAPPRTAQPDEFEDDNVETDPIY